MINLDNLGEFGESIKYFDYKNYREESINLLEEIFEIYDDLVKKNIGGNLALTVSPLMVRDKIYELLNDEEYLNVFINKRLDSLVDEILKSIYALDGFNHVSEQGLKQRLMTSEHEIPLLSARNRKTNSASIAEELSTIRFDELRECLFETVGFSFTPARELKEMRDHTAQIDKREALQKLWEKNGLDIYYAVALVLKPDRDPLNDDLFYEEQRDYFVNSYTGNISKFAINSKKVNMQP